MLTPTPLRDAVSADRRPDPNDVTIHVVVCRNDTIGDYTAELRLEHATSFDIIVEMILSGDLDDVKQVVAMNHVEDWSRDVSSDIADLALIRFWREGWAGSPPPFVDANHAPELLANLEAEDKAERADNRTLKSPEYVGLV